MNEIIDIALVVTMGVTLFGLMVYVFYIGLTSDTKKNKPNDLPPVKNVKRLKKA
ncbi:MAG: hypothetical protein AB7W47_12825 [Calditrichaceae bacterium]